MTLQGNHLTSMTAITRRDLEIAANSSDDDDEGYLDDFQRARRLRIKQHLQGDGIAIAKESAVLASHDGFSSIGIENMGDLPPMSVHSHESALLMAPAAVGQRQVKYESSVRRRLAAMEKEAKEQRESEDASHVSFRKGAAATKRPAIAPLRFFGVLMDDRKPGGDKRSAGTMSTAEFVIKRQAASWKEWLQFIPPNCEALDNASLKCFAPRTLPRTVVYNIIKSPVFEGFILLAIVANCVFIALDDPTADRQPQYLKIAEIVFATIFTIEMLMKIFALGLVMHRGAYWRSKWNVLDCFIVLLTYIAFIPSAGNFTALRALRVLRPLRSMNHLPGLKVLVSGLLRSFKGLIHVFILTMILFFIGGILGVQIFGGLYLRRCMNLATGVVNSEQYCKNGAHWRQWNDTEYNPTHTWWPELASAHSSEVESPISFNLNKLGGQYWGTTCPDGFACVDWHNPHFGYMNFDNVGTAFLLIFQVVTFEGWREVLHISYHALGQLTFFYFFFLVVLGGYFIPNLVLAVISDRFADAQKREERRQLIRQLLEDDDFLIAELEDRPTYGNMRSLQEQKTLHMALDDKGLAAHNFPLGSGQSVSSFRTDAQSYFSGASTVSLQRIQNKHRRSMSGGTGEIIYLTGAAPPAPHVNDPHTGMRSSSRNHDFALDEQTEDPVNSNSAEDSTEAIENRQRSELIPVPIRVSSPGAESSPMSSTRQLTGTASFERNYSVVGTEGGSASPPSSQPGSPVIAARRQPSLTAQTLAVIESENTPSSNERVHSLLADQAGSRSASRAASTSMGSSSGSKGQLGGRNPLEIPDPDQRDGPTAKDEKRGSETTDSSTPHSARSPNRKHRPNAFQNLIEFIRNLLHVMTEGYPRYTTFIKQEKARYRQEREELELFNYQDQTPQEIERRRQEIEDEFEVGITFEQYTSDNEHLQNSTIFNILIFLCIVLNIVLLASQHHNEPNWVSQTIDYGNYIFGGIFLLEMFLKWAASGFYFYFKDPFNAVDCIINVASALEYALIGTRGISVFRALRILRVLKLLKNSPELRQMVQVILAVLQTTMYLNLILLLLLFIFALLGMQLFGAKLKHLEEPGTQARLSRLFTQTNNSIAYNGTLTYETFLQLPQVRDEVISFDRPYTVDTHFDSFIYAFYAAFQVVSRDQWVEVLWNTMAGGNPYLGAIYVITLVLIGNYVIVNLFLAQLIGAFAYTAPVETLKNDAAKKGGSHSPKTKKVQVVNGKAVVAKADGDGSGSDSDDIEGGGDWAAHLADEDSSVYVRERQRLASSVMAPDAAADLVRVIQEAQNVSTKKEKNLIIKQLFTESFNEEISSITKWRRRRSWGKDKAKVSTQTKKPLGSALKRTSLIPMPLVSGQRASSTDPNYLDPNSAFTNASFASASDRNSDEKEMSLTAHSIENSANNSRSQSPAAASEGISGGSMSLNVSDDGERGDCLSSDEEDGLSHNPYASGAFSVLSGSAKDGASSTTASGVNVKRRGMGGRRSSMKSFAFTDFDTWSVATGEDDGYVDRQVKAKATTTTDERVSKIKTVQFKEGVAITKHFRSDGPRCDICGARKQLPLPPPPLVKQQTADELHDDTSRCRVAATRMAKERLLRMLLRYVQVMVKDMSQAVDLLVHIQNQEKMNAVKNTADEDGASAFRQERQVSFQVEEIDAGDKAAQRRSSSVLEDSQVCLEDLEKLSFSKDRVRTCLLQAKKVHIMPFWTKRIHEDDELQRQEEDLHDKQASTLSIDDDEHFPTESLYHECVWNHALASNEPHVMSSPLGHHRRLFRRETPREVVQHWHILTDEVVDIDTRIAAARAHHKAWESFREELQREWILVHEIRTGEEQIGGALITYTGANKPEWISVTDTVSLWLFKPDNSFRIWLNYVVGHAVFDWFINVCIGLSCLVLAINDPLDTDPESTRNTALRYSSIVLTSIFLVEVGMKVIAMGFLLHKRAYLRDSWNVLDFVVVMVSAITDYLPATLLFAATQGSEEVSGVLIAVRTLRALRPLRVIRRNRELRLVVITLLRSAYGIFNVMFLAAVNYLIFGILAVQLLSGQMYFCTDAQVLNQVDCTGEYFNYERQEFLPRLWVNSAQNYDHIGNSILALFEVSSGEWVDALYRAVATRCVGCAPVRESSPAIGLLFVTFYVMGNFFLMNLFIGVVINNFNRAKDRLDGLSLVTEEQRLWVDSQRLMVKFRPTFRIGRPQLSADEKKTPYGRFRLAIFDLADSVELELAVISVITINVFFMAVQHHNQSDGVSDVLHYANYVFVGLYFIELAIKMPGFGLGFFRSGWNQYTLFIWILAVID